MASKGKEPKTEMFALYVTAAGNGVTKNTYAHVFPALHEHAARRLLIEWYLNNNYRIYSISRNATTKRRKKG